MTPPEGPTGRLPRSIDHPRNYPRRAAETPVEGRRRRYPSLARRSQNEGEPSGPE